jgi:CO/xanthine dehydrogenase Mo-binding subunit
LQWSRADEFLGEPYGSAMTTKIRAGLNAKGIIVDWQCDVWSGTHSIRPAGAKRAGNLFAARQIAMPLPLPPVGNIPQPRGGGDRNAVPLYSFASHRITKHLVAQMPLRVSALRGLGAYTNVFAIESFMDEIAHATEQDPIDFRLALLDGAGKNAGSAPNSVGGAHRLANVLRKVKAKSNWGATLAADEGMGVATTYGQERNMPTWVACVAKARVDRASGAVTVSDLYMDFDCGTMIHPDGALAQAEGSALWGLSLALHEGTTIENGQVADSNLNSYSPLRLIDIPQLHIDFVDSSEFPVGLGEPGVTVVGAAVANAIFNAVGVRMRDLPIRPAAVKAALKA